MPAAKRHLLLPRQTFFPNPFGDVSDECVKAAEEYVDSLPTPDPDLVQAIDVPTEEGCYTLPESLHDAWSSYSSEAKSWATAHADIMSKAEEHCPESPVGPEFEWCDGEDPNENLATGFEASFFVAVAAAAAVAAALAL
ncbi:uncharacterized protein J7T54_004742 [Emericellopsis cladophorae]|uniref:Uncharacterized protein n=1 Tax=Emericellopsis cladophorae TaxID=2686198 RepID=A0A9P9Y645_9HYPO|nr:uncharacterized protein J7T54_004742 [Emericellopsis cladophorae]KAI6784196.1 hypothetical protein J7T54_004742 [Emericellopsis cladophorae]